MSKILSQSALKALNRIGDLMLPGDADFPKFSEVGGLEHIDDLVTLAPQDDIKDLDLLLKVLSIMPTWVLRWVIKRMENARTDTGSFGTLFRQLEFGLRGLIYSSYYSPKVGSSFKGTRPVDVIGCEINRVYE